MEPYFESTSSISDAIDSIFFSLFVFAPQHIHGGFFSSSCFVYIFANMYHIFSYSSFFPFFIFSSFLSVWYVLFIYFHGTMKY